MKYGIANIKGGSGTSIPTINVSQSQWGSNSFTPTQEQLSLMLNNDVIIFKCDYIGKESVMQKVRWDGIYSDDSLTPQTTTIFLSPSILTSDENDNISGITQLMVVIPQNSQTAYVSSIGTDWTKETSGVYLVSGTLNEDSGEYYFDYGDIDIDESVLKYGDLLIYTSSNNATKIYMVDYIDDDYVYVVEKASIGGGSQLYQHNIKINLSSFKGTMTIINKSNTAINTGLKLFNFLKHTAFSTAYMFSGYHYNSASDIRNAYSISAESDNHIWWLTSKGTYDIAYTSIDENITDVVEEL